MESVLAHLKRSPKRHDYSALLLNSSRQLPWTGLLGGKIKNFEGKGGLFFRLPISLGIFQATYLPISLTNFCKENFVENMNTQTSDNYLGFPAIPAKFREKFDEKNTFRWHLTETFGTSHWKSGTLVENLRTFQMIRRTAIFEFGAVQKSVQTL